MSDLKIGFKEEAQTVANAGIFGQFCHAASQSVEPAPSLEPAHDI